MKYTVKERYRKKGVGGRAWNLPYGTECESDGRFITLGGIPVCAVTSQDAYDFFVRDDDGEGAQRARLINDIKITLSLYPERWERVWDAPEMERFKRPEHKDHWLWGYEFFNADVEDLRHILEVLNV